MTSKASYFSRLLKHNRRQLWMLVLLAFLAFGQISAVSHDHGPLYKQSVECNICVLHAGVHAAAFGHQEFSLPLIQTQRSSYQLIEYRPLQLVFAGNRDPPATV